jgi:hypothetical protein
MTTILDLARKLQRGKAPPAPIGRLLGFVLREIEPGRAVRLMAAIYSSRAVPREITTLEEAEKWAGVVAGELKTRCCLVWSRRISCWFGEDGTVAERTKAVPGEPNTPWVKIGGKGPAFLFGDDLGTLSKVDWPKKPDCGPDKRQSESTP